MISSENPFAVLKASTRDRKARLNELADEAALHGDHDVAVNARNFLSNPRTRLAAEVAWFPGLSPKRIVLTLEHISQGGYPLLDGFNELSSANFLIEALAVYAQGDSSNLLEGIRALASHVEDIDIDDVLQAINEDRQAAGLPTLSDPTLLEAEIAERVKHFERTATTYLEDLPSMEMVAVYESLIAESTNNGEDVGHRLIDALIDSYELKASSFLSEEAERINGLIKKAQAAAHRHISTTHVRASIKEIIGALRIWDNVAQPIQLAYKSRGIDHDDSKQLASNVLGLAIYFNNEHDYFEEAKLLGEALQEMFSEVVTLNDRVDENVETFSGNASSQIEKQRRDAQNKASFEREISYETEFGMIFKDKFRISPEGFDYKGELFPLDKICNVRWGAVRNHRNGIYTGTDYFFGYGTNTQSVLLQPKEHQYQEIIKRAWRAVCIKILLGWIEQWGKGANVNIAGVEVADDGLVLRRSRLFKEDETKLFSWFDLTKSSGNGNLNFTGKSDKKYSISFSFKDNWNIHILDFALDKIWEGKARKLSKVFGN